MAKEIYNFGEQPEVLIRKGPAPEFIYPNDLKYRGYIMAPFEFLEKKKGKYDPEDSTVFAQIESGKLTINLNESETHGYAQIIGDILDSREIADWGINSDRRLSAAELRKFIYMRKFHFASRDIAEALFKQLSVWNVKVERTFKDHKDSNTGNSLLLLENAVTEIDLNREFDLQIPLFKGFDPVKFRVEIGLEVRSNGVEMFLISPEYEEIIYTEKKRIIDEQISKISEIFDCSIVHG